MLYDRWRQVALTHANETAIWDAGSQQRWSFRELASAAEKAAPETAAIVFAHGNSVEFILTTLRAWRHRTVLCPLELDQSPPAVSPPPTPCRHLKVTSATSGKARVVMFTEEQLAADARNIVAAMGLRPDWPNLATISLAHSYGFSNLVLPLLLYGIPLILAPSPLPEMLRLAAQGHRDLVLPGVPALWRAWFEAGVIPSSLRLGISAGAPLTVELEQSIFSCCGVKIHNFYGSSECGGIAFDDTKEPRTSDGEVGAIMKNVTVEIESTGCVVVLGEAVAVGYWPDSFETLVAGRFQTSDLAEVVAGRIFLRGRTTELINVAGRKIAPATIESVLCTHPGVKECLVFGVPAARGERTDTIVAAVVPRGVTSEGDLRQFLLTRLPGWQVPRGWWFVEALDHNLRGKVSRSEWARKYRALLATKIPGA
jgi:acyl-CoA synthetase (AMP-forming)/AMP-acid ligase II